MICNHYVGQTSQLSQNMRDFSVRVKLNPVRSMIQGKGAPIIEDFIVRGTTICIRVKLCALGARKIHMRVFCPTIKFPCFYGIYFSSKGELITANTPLNNIARLIGLDYLHYLFIPVLLLAMNQKDSYWIACFNGEYPVPLPGVPGPDVTGGPGHP